MVVNEGLAEEIQEQRTRVMIQSENGLFARILDGTTTTNARDKILNLLKEAEEKLSSNPVEAQHKLDLATCELDESIEKAGLRWRLRYFYGIYVFSYMVALFVLFLSIWFYILIYHNGTVTIFWIPSWALVWGGVGSVLRGTYWLWYQVNRRRYRKIWALWFLAAPLMGCVLGAIMYLIFIAGYIAASQSQLTNESLPMLLCALAGFSWPWAINVMTKLQEILGVKTAD